MPGLTVLFHPDVGRIGERVPLAGLLSGQAERLSRNEPDFAAPAQSPTGPLSDPYISRSPVVLQPGGGAGSVRLLCGETRTRVVADGEPVAGERELTQAEIERGVVLLLAERIVLLLSLIDPLGASIADYGLIGESPPMLRLRREIGRLATLSVPVLLRGETGTGKELAARALHEAGPRQHRPFLAINMGAIPPTLAAAELFGAARGAYTGAERRREGYFSRAQGGTLFLDEIGEAPAEVQVLLLRALENGEIQPIGASEPFAVDVRLVAATDADLAAAAAADRFRAPLLYRLSGYEIETPPLRRRREDFGRLLLHFLRQELKALGGLSRLEAPPAGGRPWLPAPLVAHLAGCTWPGNLRQLSNFVRRLAIAGHDLPEVRLDLQLEGFIRDANAPERTLARLQANAGEEARPAAPQGTPGKRPRKAYRNPAEVGEEELLEALRANSWRLQPTAARLGISRASLYDRIERSSSLRKAADLGREEIADCFSECAGDLDAMSARLEVSKRGLQRRMHNLGLELTGR